MREAAFFLIRALTKFGPIALEWRREGGSLEVIFRHGLLLFLGWVRLWGAFRLFYGGAERFVVFDRGWPGRREFLKEEL